MREQWFFAEPSAWSPGRVQLSLEESHHALKALRLQPPDVITVTDGCGRVARCAVASTATRVEAEVLSEERRERSRPTVHVYQSASKGSKLDTVVERLAELGVAKLHCFSSERSVVRWDDRKVDKLNQRWEAIARSAAKQSRQPFVMDAAAGLSWEELLVEVKAEDFALTLWEDASLPLRSALEGSVGSIALIVGPEGGFTRDEAEALADAGAPLVSLGPTILRTENAALVTVSALLFHYGLLG